MNQELFENEYYVLAPGPSVEDVENFQSVIAEAHVTWSDELERELLELRDYSVAEMALIELNREHIRIHEQENREIGRRAEGESSEIMEPAEEEILEGNPSLNAYRGVIADSVEHIATTEERINGVLGQFRRHAEREEARHRRLKTHLVNRRCSERLNPGVEERVRLLETAVTTWKDGLAVSLARAKNLTLKALGLLVSPVPSFDGRCPSDLRLPPLEQSLQVDMLSRENLDSYCVGYQISPKSPVTVKRAAVKRFVCLSEETSDLR